LSKRGKEGFEMNNGFNTDVTLCIS
jgi:hypothetical protein